MRVNLEKAIKNIKIKVGFYRPLYEAIVNAIQAKATVIDISFDVEKKDHKDLICGYSVKDNGIGFTDANIDSFLTLWTEHNSDMGALGSGRILCLKVFKNILIESQTKNTVDKQGHKIYIDFNKNFSSNTINDIEKEYIDSDESFTIVHYKNLTESYQNENEILYLDVIKHEVFISLLPLFIEYSENQLDLTINVQGSEWITKTKLTSMFKKLNFLSEEFKVKSSIKDNKTEYTFKLTYQITKDGKNKLDQFYGASFRKVTNFPNNTSIKRLPNNASGIFCLSSNYLKEIVADSREEFNLKFNENNATEEFPLLFRDINNKLSEVINKILRREFKDIDKSLQAEKKKAIDECPHLIQYIKDIDKLTINKNEIIKIAESKFEKKFKETKKEIIDFTTNIQKTKNFNKEKYIEITKEFTEVGQEQLAFYIGYRQTIIDMLFHVYECNNDASKVSFNEDFIHNLIMPTKKIKFNNQQIITENNFWILDDKFMSFSYAASDVEIEKFVTSLGQEMKDEIDKDYFGDDRPDLMMLYSDEFDKPKDVVIVELKKVNIQVYDRSKAIDQINLYADLIQDHIPDVNDIFVYAIVDIDVKLERILKNRGFFPKAYTKDGHNMYSYYMYNPNNRAHVHILSFHHLITDASNRNKLFLSILKNEISSSKDDKE